MKRSGVDWRKYAEIVGFGFPIVWLFGRLGCFFTHDHPGLETDFFLGVSNYQEQGVTRHDLGLYEFLWSLAVVPLFLLAWRRRPA